MEELIPLTVTELAILTAALEFISDSPISYQALEGYDGISMETIFEEAYALKKKLKQS